MAVMGRLGALGAVAGLLAALLVVTTPAAGAGEAQCATPGAPTTVAYRRIAGVPANRLSLDIHAPAGACDAPVVMWVHGGGYHRGDKANQVADKVRLFNHRGWIFVSVNYRLTVAGNPRSAHYPDHYTDVAASVAWVHANIGRWGGDPGRVALLGHSAGADIVSNVTTDPQYLRRRGLDLSAVRCAGPLDTEGFDKATAGPRRWWVDALANFPDYVAGTSAINHVAPGIGIPRTIGVYRGSPLRQHIERAYLDALDAAGVPTARIDARSLSHGEVNTRIGAPGDRVMTPPLVAFLRACFATPGG